MDIEQVGAYLYRCEMYTPELRKEIAGKISAETQALLVGLNFTCQFNLTLFCFRAFIKRNYERFGKCYGKQD